MDEIIIRCLYDILDCILEVEDDFIEKKSYGKFRDDKRQQRVVERLVSIIGEAVVRITRVDGNFPLDNAKDIKITRNRIIHDYNNVTPAFLWSLVTVYLPALKAEVQSLLTLHILNTLPYEN